MRKRVADPAALSLPMAARNFSVEEAAAAIGVGRAFVFDLIRTKKIKSVRLGRRRLVPGAVLERYLADLAKAAA